MKACRPRKDISQVASSADVEIMVTDRHAGENNEFFLNILKLYISTCTNWAYFIINTALK